MSACRFFVWGLAGWLAACSSAPQPAGATCAPIELHGADAAAMVVQCVTAPCAAAVEVGCWLATSPAAQATLLRRVGCRDAAAPPVDTSLVVVVEPGAARLQRVVIGSEEGVDVLTLQLGVAPVAADAEARTAILLWVEHRPHQLAVVLRDLVADHERTVGIFDGR